MLLELNPNHILPTGHVPRLFQERHVDITLNIAGQTGVSIPVPRPPKPTRFVDEYDLLDREDHSLKKPNREEKTTVPGADDQVPVSLLVQKFWVRGCRGFGCGWVG